MREFRHPCSNQVCRLIIRDALANRLKLPVARVIACAREVVPIHPVDAVVMVQEQTLKEQCAKPPILVQTLQHNIFSRPQSAQE